MKRSLAALFVSSCVLVAVVGRKELLESKASRGELGGHTSSPRLMDQQFKFGSSSYYWSLDMTPPVLKVGWEIDQGANSQALTWALNPAHYQYNPRLAAKSATNTAQGTWVTSAECAA